MHHKGMCGPAAAIAARESQCPTPRVPQPPEESAPAAGLGPKSEPPFAGTGVIWNVLYVLCQAKELAHTCFPTVKSKAWANLSDGAR